MSGPARRAPQAPHPSAGEGGLALGVLQGLAGLSRHQALDRLIRGRVWIVLIAFALIGIVTLQLLVLNLNARIGRTLVREAQLQRENATLSIESSELASGERVESLAARLGMELMQVGAVRFLSVQPRSDITRAAAALSRPAQTSSAGSSEAASASPSEASAPSAASGEAASGEQASAGQPSGEGSAAAATASAPGEQPSTTASPSDQTPAAQASAPTQPESSAGAGAQAATGATAQATGGATGGATPGGEG